jgi:hypothetical protein
MTLASDLTATRRADTHALARERSEFPIFRSAPFPWRYRRI